MSETHFAHDSGYKVLFGSRDTNQNVKTLNLNEMLSINLNINFLLKNTENIVPKPENIMYNINNFNNPEILFQYYYPRHPTKKYILYGHQVSQRLDDCCLPVIMHGVSCPLVAECCAVSCVVEPWPSRLTVSWPFGPWSSSCDEPPQ